MSSPLNCVVSLYSVPARIILICSGLGDIYFPFELGNIEVYKPGFETSSICVASFTTDAEFGKPFIPWQLISFEQKSFASWNALVPVKLLY